MTDRSNGTNMSADGDSVRWGRRAETFAPTPEWILVAGLTPQAQALYTQLLAHVNRSRQNGLAWPGMDALAELLGYSRRQSVRKYVAELVALDAITVRRKRCATGVRHEYIVNELPADGYAGHLTLKAFHDARRARKAAAHEGWGATAPQGSDAQAPQGSCATAPRNQMNSTRRSDPDDVLEDSLAARPRPAGRGPESKPKSNPRAERRADYPANDDWIADSLEETVENILDHVGGGPDGLANVLYAKISPPIDMDTYEELPFEREPTPRHLMNIALKATRWWTVNFAYVKEQERLGRGPDYDPTPVQPVASGDVWDLPGPFDSGPWDERRAS